MTGVVTSAAERAAEHTAEHAGVEYRNDRNAASTPIDLIPHLLSGGKKVKRNTLTGSQSEAEVDVCVCVCVFV